jgi:uncharacterized protein (TIGR02147 family)
MSLVEYERDYFCEMVRFDHAKTDEEKKIFFNKMLAIAAAHKVKIIEADSYHFFEDWKNPVLRELAPSMPGAKPLALARACRPEITAAEVTESLNFLVKAGFLKKDEEGRFVQTDKFITTGPLDVTPVAVRGMHRQMGELALETIEGVAQDERHFSGLTMGLTHEAYEEIVQEIDACRKRIAAIATRDSEIDDVYRLNMQLFPITKKNSNKNV